MSDNERARDHQRDRDGRREPRGGRDREHERSHTGSERRNRSRSPRPDRSGRRDGGRYRSRSPFRRDERNGDRGRSDKGRGGPTDRGRSDRGPPTGSRGSAAPRGPSNVSRPPPKAIKPDLSDEGESRDVVMKEERVRPEGMDDETWDMAQVMGFVGFKSTKNTKVPGNDKNYGVRKDKQMEARQYMNRNGGFNRPLSPSRG